ncbi:MAG TPA: ABC transporter ATP-binding protein [Crenalkalicoccus sp.]|jgi:branched-chain amino acid transport system ATP-binding protein|nr:ABC transporter ATP-binding protein [Crenalkalicoccus sp.]
MRPPPGARLALRSVSKAFGGVRAVSDIALEVPPGQLFAVIGPNGAGKTTLFNIIAGAVPASAGEVLLDGAPIGALPMHRRVRLGIARTFQNLRIVPDLTVAENVLLGADAHRPGGVLSDMLRPSGRRDGRGEAASVAALLERVGLAHREGDAAGGLSYGEGKLLELARALAARPRLLLLDEPAAGLPHAEAARMAALIRGIAMEGTTVLLVEHNMRLVMSVAERILVMAGGRAIALGPPQEVQRSPAVIDAYLGREETEDA